MARGSKDFFSIPVFPSFGVKTLVSNYFLVDTINPCDIFSITGKGIINGLLFSCFASGNAVFPKISIVLKIDDQVIRSTIINVDTFSLLIGESNSFIRCTGFYWYNNRIYFELFFDQQFSFSSKITVTNDSTVNIPAYITGSVQYIV